MLKSMNLSTFFHTFSNDNAPPITSTFQNSSHESFIVINDTNETFASCTRNLGWVERTKDRSRVALSKCKDV